RREGTKVINNPCNSVLLRGNFWLIFTTDFSLIYTELLKYCPCTLWKKYHTMFINVRTQE
ncbi:MAG: hypothetical protein ACQ9MH_24960, partial [Nitrospinales bacterium]